MYMYMYASCNMCVCVMLTGVTNQNTWYTCIYMYIPIELIMSNFAIKISCTSLCCSEFLKHGAELAQQWFVCAPLGIYLELINKDLMLLVTI